MVIVKGSLTDGASKLITDCTIILKAKKTTSNVLVKTEAHEVSETGAYNMNVQPGLYDVILLENGFPPKQLGTIEVKSNSKTGTLNDFLILPVTGEIVSSELLDQLIEERTLAQQAAASAKSDATKANTAVTGYVKKTGDTMSDSLNIKKTGAGLNIFNDSGNGMTWRVEASGNLVLIDNRNGTLVAKKYYDKSANAFRYLNLDDVTINGKSVLKVVDSGLGATVTTNLIAGSIDMMLPAGFYVVNSATSGSVPHVASNVVIQNRNGNVQTAVAVSADPKQPMRTGVYAQDKWTWQEYITPETISQNNIMQTGDYGLGSATQNNTSSVDLDTENFATGFYSGNKWRGSVVGMPFGLANESATWMYLLNQNLASAGSNYKLQIAGMNQANAKRLAFRYKVNGISEGWSEFISSANSTVDSNGFYKKASPIVRLVNPDNGLGAYESYLEGYVNCGAGYANSEALGVDVKYIDVGHYEIHNSLGFAKSGWYITLPEDANGNKKIFAEYSQDENGIITVKCFTRKFDIERCEIVADKPTDIPDSRWIDIRLDMPETDSSIDDVTQEPEATE